MLGRQELVNKIVSKNTGVSEEEVTRIMDFSYKELTSKLQNCDHTFIYVRELGTFGLKHKAIKNRLYRLHEMICRRKKMQPTPLVEKAIKTMRDEMFRLFKVRKMVKTTYNLKDSINNKG